MKSKQFAKASVLALLILTTSAGAFAQQTNPKRPLQEPPRRVNRGPVKSPTGESFHITRSPESTAEFNVIFSDGEEQVVSGAFSVEQLQVFREIMLEARKFAFTEKSVGVDEPVTTRFFSREAAEFLIDVTKFKDQSQFFITMKTSIGRMTVEAGTIRRDDKKEAGFFFDILSSLEAQLPPSSGQTQK